MTAWDVRYTEQFDNQVMELPESVYDRVEASVDVLATNPGLARDLRPHLRGSLPTSALPVLRCT